MKTLYCNAQVYTGDGSIQDCLLVENGKFLFAGPLDQGETLGFDRKIDLAGKFVCPGFNDSHMHLLSYGNNLSLAPLHRHTGSLEDMLSCLKDTKPGSNGWIQGRGWNQDYFTDVRRMPNRWDLDRVSTQFPVCAVRACGHTLSVNSKALELLEIDSDTSQMPGGEIVMENGIPNGIFLDNAMELVTARIPAPGPEDIEGMILGACSALNAMGITSVQSDDFSTFLNLPWEMVMDAFEKLDASGELTVRVYEQANFTNPDQLRQFREAGYHTGKGSSLFRTGPLKLLGDGSLGARTAFLSRPYADAPETKGLGIFTQGEFDTMIGYAHNQGLQVAVHCIGDACLDMVLNSFEKVLAENPRQDHRHGIVHCQITRPDQLQRIAKLKLHVYAQSIFLDYDLHMVTDRVGESLANSSYSWKTLMDMGVSVSNGSDCPVELPDVMAGIQCAVTRCDRAGAGPYLPEQAFSLEEAIDSFTTRGAYASFEDTVKGKIAPGMLADFVILEENPFRVPSSRLQDIQVAATYLGGKLVYAK